MPTKEDAARFSGEVSEKLKCLSVDISVIPPSSEFQGTRQGYWTAWSSRFEPRPEVDFAVWPCRKEKRYHLGVRLLGVRGESWPEGLSGHDRQMGSLHTRPDTAAHRLMGLLTAQALALETGTDTSARDTSTDGGADAVSHDWIG